jgi:hypothetical protein
VFEAPDSLAQVGTTSPNKCGAKIARIIIDAGNRFEWAATLENGNLDGRFDF